MRLERCGRDPATAHARQLEEAGRKGDEICRRDLPITVGRKPRRFWSVRPSVTLPHAPGLSQKLGLVERHALPR
jgi:hypothetical protein